MSGSVYLRVKDIVDVGLKINLIFYVNAADLDGLR